MFHRYRTKGVVLKRDDWKEADRFFTVYTKDFGKIKVLGRGIRKISSKLKSGMEVFHFSEIAFIQGRNYKTLVDASLIEDFKKIRTHLKKMIVAYKIVRVFDNLIQEGEKDKKAWILLLDSLKELNNRDEYKIVYYYFLWNLFSLLGYSPNLYRCSVCQKKLQYKENYLNLEDGGIVCLNCREKTKKDESISPEIIKILRVLLKSKESFFKLSIDQKNMNLLKGVSKKYLSLFLN
jgi:DNA repair protein RecO (recombination protein O)